MSIIHNFTSKQKVIISIFFILIITFISFYPSLNNGFVNWDDTGYVVDNNIIQNISSENIKKCFTSFYMAGYIPLTLLSYSVEYYFFNLDPWIYHLTNFIFHIINSILIFFLIYIMWNKALSAFLIAILFALHPLHVESVAWISERKDVLSTFFFLLCLISYITYMQKGKRIYYYFGIVLFICSLLSKPMTVTLPVLLLLFDYVLHIKFTKCIIIEKIPFFIISFIFGIIAIFAQDTVKAMHNQALYTFFDNILVASYGFLFYQIKFLVPLNLSAIYPYPVKTGNSLPLIFLISPLIVSILFFIIFLSAKYSRKIIFGYLFFFITILPVIKIIPLGNSMVSDRYAYIPSIGLCYLLSEGLLFLYHNDKKRKYLCILISVVFILSLSLLTFQRCMVWRDSLTLWNDVLYKYPDSDTALYNRGQVYLENGEYELAIVDFNRAVVFMKDYAPAYTGRGMSLYYKGEYEKALSDYNRSLLIDPNYPVTYYNRALVYEKKGDPCRAISDYSQVLILNNTFIDAYINRGIIYASRKEYDKAIKDFTEALNIRPDEKAYYNRGLAYFYKKDYINAYRDVLKMKEYGYSVEERFVKELEQKVNGEK